MVFCRVYLVGPLTVLFLSMVGFIYPFVERLWEWMSKPEQLLWRLQDWRQLRPILLSLVLTVQVAVKARWLRSLRYRHDPPLLGLTRAWCL